MVYLANITSRFWGGWGRAGFSLLPLPVVAFAKVDSAEGAHASYTGI